MKIILAKIDTKKALLNFWASIISFHITAHNHLQAQHHLIKNTNYKIIPTQKKKKKQIIVKTCEK